MSEIMTSAKQRIGQAILDEMKRHEKPWGLMTEQAQRASLDRLDDVLHNAIAALVDDVASREFNHARISVEKVEFNAKGVKIAGVAPKHANGVHDLADLAGDDVVIVMTEANHWVAGRLVTLATPDQLDIEDAIAESEPAQDAMKVGDFVMVEHEGQDYFGEITGEDSEGASWVVDVGDGALIVAKENVKIAQRQVEHEPEITDDVPLGIDGTLEPGDVVLVGDSRQRATVVAHTSGASTAMIECEVDGRTVEMEVSLAHMRHAA